MALVKRVLSIGNGGLRPIRYNPRRSFRNSSKPLLMRLLQVPISQFKATLDSVDSSAFNNFEFSYPLVTGLRSSSPKKAELVLEWRLERILKNRELNHDHCSTLLSLCAKIQNVSLAMRVFTSMEAYGIKPTSSVLNSLIHVCLSSGEVIMALSLFQIMESSEGYKPDPQTYDIFISGFSNLRDVSKMQAWYVAKKTAGFTANLQNYESLVAGCIKMGDVDGANRFYEEMMSSGVIPSAPILEYVLEGFCKQKNCDRVKEFLRFLLECGFEINGNMIEKVVGLYSDLKKEDKMEELITNLMEFNQVGEALQLVHCGIIKMYAMLDRLDDVEYSVGRMMTQGLSFRSPDIIEKVISSYFRQKAYDRLDLFLEHIKGHYKLTRSIYDLLVAGYKRAGIAEKLDLVLKDIKLAGL